MIDTVLNLLFRCSHSRLTRPVTPVSKAGVPHGETYVVCLDCGKQFSYDLKQMRIGKPVEVSRDGGVLHPEVVGRSRNQKRLRYAVWAAVPLAWFLGKAIKHEAGATPPAATKEKDKPGA